MTTFHGLCNRFGSGGTLGTQWLLEVCRLTGVHAIRGYKTLEAIMDSVC